MYIELQHINKTFGDYQASKDVTFGIEKGKMIALLGPSGSGKTTILRMLAGLETQDSGDIYIDGKLVNNLSPSQRQVGFMFQNYALFPYLTVYNNIAYGMKIQKKSKQEIAERVKDLLDLVGLPGLENRYPDQLSGGQKQRIALARALAPSPDLLLLDEPFAAVDAKNRKKLRAWLREIIDKVGVTSIFVTHDQDEAIEIADEIVVTNLGRVEQVGSPQEIYLKPQTPFVAQFIGQSSVIEDFGRFKGFENTRPNAQAIIRPEFVDLYRRTAEAKYQKALEDAVIKRIAFRGDGYELDVDVKGILLKVATALKYDDLAVGDQVKLLIARLYEVDGETIICRWNQNIRGSSNDQYVI